MNQPIDSLVNITGIKLSDMLGKKEKVCGDCGGVGFIMKTEWVNDDDSYDVEVRCECNED